MLWKKITNGIIEKSLQFRKGAVVKVTHPTTGVVSTLDLAELAALDSIGAADLAKIDGITNGTAAAGKALVLDANSEIDIITTGAIVAADSSLGVSGEAAAQGGAIVITGGTSSTATNAGGASTLKGGAGNTSGAGGEVFLTGGIPGVTGVGGAATVAAGLGGATSGAGGVASITGGAGTAGNSAGGISKVVGGAGQGTAAGGKAQVTGGASGAGATGNGGNTEVAGGAALSTDGSGGAVSITGGALSGTGVQGGVHLRSKAAAGAGDNLVFTQQSAATTGIADGNWAPTVAQFINGILSGDVTTGRTLTTPTGAQLSTACGVGLVVGDAFNVYVSLIGSAGADDILTMTAGDGNVTFIGTLTVGPIVTNTAPGAATWRFRNTGTNTWVGYRVA